MKMTFVSVYLNNHQFPLANVFASLCKDDYRFVETKPSERLSSYTGYKKPKDADYLLRGYSEGDLGEIEQWVSASDVVVSSGCYEPVERRIAASKPTFRYAERPLKDGDLWYKRPVRYIRWHRQNPPKKRLYMLCAGAYTAGDYDKYGLFRGKCYKWGYFPEVRRYADVDLLLGKKKKSTLLWVGRLIDWKHPDAAVRLASRLKESGYQFELNIIGSGEMESQLEKMISDLNLGECVHLLGAMQTESVREYMEQSRIYLFTSDRKEGWGAVLNEAMNSGCAVVASHAIGSVPFLVKDGENGSVYESGNEDELFFKVKCLLDNPDKGLKMGKNAYQTIVTEWNAEVAAERFVKLSQAILDGDPSPNLFDDGPCSVAEIINEDRYRR